MFRAANAWLHDVDLYDQVLLKYFSLLRLCKILFVEASIHFSMNMVKVATACGQHVSCQIEWLGDPARTKGPFVCPLPRFREVELLSWNLQCLQQIGLSWFV